MKQSVFALLVVLLAIGSLPAWAQNPHCEQVSGVLMTNINAIALPTAKNGTNLGPVFGDLAGSVAATILGPDGKGGFWVQHYWVTASGDTIKFDQADLTPSAVTPPGKSAPAADLAAVRWGDYKAKIVPGGTGKYANATGILDCFGLADFTNLTLVLRYRGEVCY
jgi:hypothetical protein